MVHDTSFVSTGSVDLTGNKGKKERKAGAETERKRLYNSYEKKKFYEI